MKNIYGMMAAVLLVGVTGCSQEEVTSADMEDTALRISAGRIGSVIVETRAGDDSWNANSHIGVFAYTGGSPTDASAEMKAENVEYICHDGGATGEFVPAGDPIYYKGSANWKAFAYYPRQELTDNKMEVKCADNMWKYDVSREVYADVTSEQDLDILTTRGGDGVTVNRRNTDVQFADANRFEHRMSKVTIKFDHNDPAIGSYLRPFDEYGVQEGAKFEFGPLVWTAQYDVVEDKFNYDWSSHKMVDLVDLADKAITGTGATSDYIWKRVEGEFSYDTYEIREFYVLPQKLTGRLVFQYTKDGETVSCSLGSDEIVFEPGKAYEITINVKDNHEMSVGGVGTGNWDGGSDLTATMPGGMDNGQWSGTKVGDIMYQDGTTSSTPIDGHGNAIGIVAALYKDEWVTLKEGVAFDLMNKEIIPHGLVLSLQESTQDWDSRYYSVIGDGYASAESAYPYSPDGISLQNLLVDGAGGTVLECARADNGFEAFKWCYDLNNTVTSDWVKNSTTGWYMPSYSEWVDMLVSWAYAASPQDAAVFATSLRTGDLTTGINSDVFNGLDYINAKLSAGGDNTGLSNRTTSPSNPFYWTATQTSTDNYAVMLYFNENSVRFVESLKNSVIKYRVRAVLAF